MLDKILNLENVQKLDKKEQTNTLGESWSENGYCFSDDPACLRNCNYL